MKGSFSSYPRSFRRIAVSDFHRCYLPMVNVAGHRHGGSSETEDGEDINQSDGRCLMEITRMVTTYFITII